jgi:hypothetical protein
MRNLIGWVIGITLLCWGVTSAFSIFSELKFIVDGWTWSVDQVPLSIRAVFLAVGKWASGLVSDYRAFVHLVVGLLHLPHLPQYIYDGLGVVTFSAGRGYWLGRHAQKKGKAFWDKAILIDEKSQMYRTVGREPLFMSWVEVLSSLIAHLLNKLGMEVSWLDDHLEVIRLFTWSLVYGVLVAIILAALFGTDFAYRHFAHNAML